MSRLGRDFFDRSTLIVARELLGQRLIRVLDGESSPGLTLSGRIVEVEAYVGEADQACHARCGRTDRNASMYGPPGHAYVYFVYGMHYCLNIVTEREGFPAAVLIRALEPLEGIDVMREKRSGRPDVQLTSGPARLCQALGIDRDFDGLDLCAPDSPLFFEQGGNVPEDRVVTGPRVGVRGDETALTVPWRFYVRDNRYVSR
jgi:DNA-3-methyladenine glycosylase